MQYRRQIEWLVSSLVETVWVPKCQPWSSGRRGEGEEGGGQDALRARDRVVTSA